MLSITPANVEITYGSLDTAEITISPLGRHPLHRLLFELGVAAAALVVIVLVSLFCLALLSVPANRIGEIVIATTVALAWGMGAAFPTLRRWHTWLKQRLRPPPVTIELGPTGLRLPGGRRVRFSEIAIISDEADILLEDGEEIELQLCEREVVQRWLAEVLRAAHQRSGRGSAADIPDALRAARLESLNL